MTTIKPTSPTTLSVASWCVRGTMPQKRVSEGGALRDMDYFSSIFAEKSSILAKKSSIYPQKTPSLKAKKWF